MELAKTYNPEEVEGNGTNIGQTTIFSLQSLTAASPIQ